MECATDFLQTLWDIFKAAIGVLFGAVVGWIAARFSDALRERQAERQRLEAYQANLDLLISAIDHNLGFIDIIYKQVEKGGDPENPSFRVTERLHFSPIINIIRHLIDVGASKDAVGYAQKVIQKLEVIESQVEKLCDALHNASLSEDASDLSFSRALFSVRAYTSPQSQFYKDLRGHGLTLEQIRSDLSKQLDIFNSTHPLLRYVFKF